MRHIIIICLSLLANSAFSQLVEFPLSTNREVSAKLSEVQNHTIELPFWDDFSTSTGTLDSAWWTQGSQLQVIVKPGIGVNPPSIGVATFDGIDALGNPYLPAPTDGGVDSLVSQKIDLTKVPSSLRNTVYLSFFYQFKGLGETPEEEDSLHLYFKNSAGTWDKIWPLQGNNYITDPTVFTEVFAQVNKAEYYHAEFQFMIKAIGRQNGWFDNWLVDYVYMDKRRSANDNSYLDRAFTNPSSSIFDQYTAIPFDDFVAAIDKGVLFDSTQTKLRNLESNIQPVEYSVNLYDTLANTLLEQLTFEKPIVLFPKEMRQVSSRPLSPSVLDQNADSLFLMLEYSVNSGDKFLVDSVYNNGIDTTFYAHINLKQNDTIRSYFNLKDYYAYDDGTAEYGAGINQPLGKIAYRYNIVVGKYLDRIDIYFPNIDGVQAGTPLELFVLNDFEGNENSLLISSNIAAAHNGINKFIEFKLPKPLFVTDTFFIGLTNLSSNNQWLSIGLDKNTDSFDKIFINVDGDWVPNVDVHGSLMMRPHFTSETPILGIKEEEISPIKIYPNPSPGKINIEGKFTSVKVVNMQGKNIPHHYISDNEIQIDTSTTQLLLVLIETESGSYTKRLMFVPINQ